MNNLRVKALLDRPTPRSFGMLGIVVDAGGSLQTEGVLGDLAGPLDASQLSDLVSGKHAIGVEGPTVNKPEANTLAALWIGDEFASESDRYGLSLPKLPERTAGRTDGGAYWISSTQHIWRVWDSWLVQAFRRVVGGQEERFATMMSWASADRDESRAARWLTTTQKQRDRDLAWWSRVRGGKEEVSPAQLETRFRLLIDQARSRASSSVVGFSARAKGGDNDIAYIIARRRGVTPFGFGSWLKARVKSEGGTPDRTVLQKRGQEMIDNVGALEFCLEVLRDLPPHLPDQPFVIDGIRHIEVLNALQFLVGPERFKLAFVHRSDEERRRLLISSEHLSPSTADEVMNDVTESEISLIATHASVRLEAEIGASEAERLLANLPA